MPSSFQAVKVPSFGYLLPDGEHVCLDCGKGRSLPPLRATREEAKALCCSECSESLVRPSMHPLQVARRAAAERFAAIARKYTPAGVTVSYRKSLSGRAWRDRIEAPRPVTRRALQIYLHECAHVLLGHCGNRSKPTHVKEWEAETWSFRVMREEGVPVPRKAILGAKRYVRRKIAQAQKRGAKTIDPRVQRWAS